MLLIIRFHCFDQISHNIFSSRLFKDMIFVIQLLQNNTANTTASLLLSVCYLRFQQVILSVFY